MAVEAIAHRRLMISWEKPSKTPTGMTDSGQARVERGRLTLITALLQARVSDGTV